MATFIFFKNTQKVTLSLLHDLTHSVTMSENEVDQCCCILFALGKS